jgi:hypothetical protein
MKKLIIVAVLAFLGTNLLAQREETIIGSSGWGFSGAWGGWNYNLASFNKDASPYNGGMWALEFGKRFYIGGLHYNINHYPLGGSNNFSMNSNNLLLGFTPMSYRPFHPIVSVAVGGGKLSTSSEVGQDPILTIQPAAGVEINITRWCHIDAQVGYRAVSGANFTKFKDSDFSGLYGQLNLKFGFSWGRYKNNKNGKRDND